MGRSSQSGMVTIQPTTHSPVEARALEMLPVSEPPDLRSRRG